VFSQVWVGNSNGSEEALRPSILDQEISDHISLPLFEAVTASIGLPTGYRVKGGGVTSLTS
jgi:hypothetical protein